MKCPTQRAPDLGWAARFLSMFLAAAESRFDGGSALPPQAGNASRWAPERKGGSPPSLHHLHRMFEVEFSKPPPFS